MEHRHRSGRDLVVQYVVHILPSKHSCTRSLVRSDAPATRSEDTGYPTIHIKQVASQLPLHAVLQEKWKSKSSRREITRAKRGLARKSGELPMSQSTRIRSCRVGTRADKLSWERGIASFACSCGSEMSIWTPHGCEFLRGGELDKKWKMIERPSGWQIS
jgi:hypothetical protein